MPDPDLIYRVIPCSPQAHLFEVELRIASRDGPLTLVMPAWAPGSYLIRDFAKNIIELAAWDGAGQPLALDKTDLHTWTLSGGTGPCTLRYRVFAWELSVRTAHLDLTHGYFNGPALLISVLELADRPCRIELVLPPEPQCRDWQVATSLKPIAVDERGFGVYGADDYRDLIDHPVEMGRFRSLSFAVGGILHRIALSGRCWFDEQRLIADLNRICAEHAALFDELPIDRYLFLVNAIGNGYGGLEHRYSASILCSREDLPRSGTSKPSADYQRLLGLLSHEYLHLWLGMRIRPRAFINPDLRQPATTRTLWAIEGITSYYDELALVRSGCIGEEEYLGVIAQNFTRLARTPGRFIQTLADASRDAWIKFYKADDNAPNALVSYYLKGAIVALLLDLRIRIDTAGAYSLDTVMQALWHGYGKTGIGLDEYEIESVAGEVTGLDLQGFFKQALETSDELDPTELLAGVGVSVRWRPARDAQDLGGYAECFAPVDARPSLGLRLREGETLIQTVLKGSPAERAGLAPGDQLIAIAGIRVTPTNLDRLIERTAQKGELIIHAFRRDELLTLTARAELAPADTCELSLIPNAPDGAIQARVAWLASRRRP
ncbi:M61 family metallopeptidase [Caldichromatium japonicum]|nr:PDZ domain-containing protein [Caldichromatium japonicum]